MSRFKLNQYNEGKNYIFFFMSALTSLTFILLLLAVFGYRYGYFSAGYSLMFLTKYAVYSSIIASAIFVIYIGHSLHLYKMFLNIVSSIFMFAINIKIIYFIYFQIIYLRSKPVINNIDTDYYDLLEFKVYTDHNLPKDDHNLIQKFGGFKLPNYELSPLILSDVSKEEVFNKSLNILKTMGLEITYENFEEGTIEALEKSFWYGFTDDMIIRIEKLITNDIIINVRSASRIGRSDFGKNSKRIKSYFVLMQ